MSKSLPEFETPTLPRWVLRNHLAASFCARSVYLRCFLVPGSGTLSFSSVSPGTDVRGT